MPDRNMPPDLRRLLDRQLGLVTRRQLLSGGLTPDAVSWRLSRAWRSVLPGVIDIERGGLTESRRLVAALLYAGQGAAVTGPSAARWYGITGVPSAGPVHVVVPAPRSSRSVAFATIRRSEVGDPGMRTSGAILLVSPGRAIVEAARAAPWDDHATAIVVEAVQRGICSASTVATWNDLLGRRGSAVVRRALDDVQAGAWSVPEAELAKLIARSTKLPRPLANPELKTAEGEPLTSPDVYFDDVGLAVMVHSRTYHAYGDDWEQTVAGDSDLVTHGVPVLGITPRQLSRAPDVALKRVESAYAAAKASGRRPAVTVTPRDPFRRA